MSNKIKVVGWVGCFAGVIGMILGVLITCNVFYKKAELPNNHVANEATNDADAYTFGADFYTEMYTVTYGINKNLIAIGEDVTAGMNKVLKMQETLIQQKDQETRVMGIIITLFSAFIALYSLNMIGKEPARGREEV